MLRISEIITNFKPRLKSVVLFCKNKKQHFFKFLFCPFQQNTYLCNLFETVVISQNTNCCISTENTHKQRVDNIKEYH